MRRSAGCSRTKAARGRKPQSAGVIEEHDSHVRRNAEGENTYLSNNQRGRHSKERFIVLAKIGDAVDGGRRHQQNDRKRHAAKPRSVNVFDPGGNLRERSGECSDQ
jgi:hypothetical protein